MVAPALDTERKILLTTQFDGAAFHGWQQQPDTRTVQGVLTQAVSKMVQHPVRVRSSSRTDAGVHARAMPAQFVTTTPIPAHGFLRGLNTLLPGDLAVIDAREVAPDFDVRLEACAKTYRYRFQVGHSPRPVTGRFAWYVRRRTLDTDAMAEAAAAFVGQHDFKAFRASECDSRTTLRQMHAATVSPTDADGVVLFEVTGNAFLRNMVRIMAGTLAEVGWGRRPPSCVAHALAHGARVDAGVTAPPGGLTLTTVHFEGYPRIGKPDRRSVAEAPP